MHYFSILMLFIILSLTACQHSNISMEQFQQLQENLKTAETNLQATQAALQQLQTAENAPLTHEVYFQTKSNLTAAEKVAFIKEIKTLEGIEVLKDLTVGEFSNLNDPRAMSQFGIVMTMGFANEADYQIYQGHELHLALKANCKQYLAGPPVTYDFLRK